MADIFAYDPEDDADEWWVQWGLVQERLESSCGIIASGHVKHESLEDTEDEY